MGVCLSLLFYYYNYYYSGGLSWHTVCYSDEGGGHLPAPLSFDSLCSNASSDYVPRAIWIFTNGIRNKNIERHTCRPYTNLVCNNRPPNDNDTIETNDERFYFYFFFQPPSIRIDRDRRSAIVLHSSYLTSPSLSRVMEAHVDSMGSD